MGSYSNLYISDYPIYTAKNSYNEDVVNLIFLESDYLEYERPLKNRNKITWGDTFANNDDIAEEKAFCSTAKICKERLELFGASYTKAKNDFESAIQKIKADEIYDFVNQEDITFELYLAKIKIIIDSKSKPYANDYYTTFQEYLQEFELIIQYQSINLALWSILSIVDPDSKVEYDLTSIIDSGWVSKPKENVKTEKIIVITEGKTDTEFLKICLNYFFPHLEGFYHFMDFDNSKYSAGASMLVHTIKSFVGSGIKNLTIALFDNDSAGKKEIKNLKKVKLPDNIKVLQYPEIEWAKNYPTLGPSGIQTMDINGLACSIEMYLGIDCIKENGEFTPILWSGYVQNIKQYQGEITRKDEIQKLFRTKVKNFNKTNYNLNDWKELISIITLINNAWQ